MTFIKTFENFKAVGNMSIYIANPEAEIVIESAGMELNESNGFYIGENVDAIISLLEENGFESHKDFLVINDLNEALNVKYIGHEAKGDGVEIFVDINGHKYGYSQKEGDLDIADIARKFEKMLQFSAGRALTWLKKHTVLTTGSKSVEKTDTANIKEGKGHDKEHEEMEEAPTDIIDTPPTGDEPQHYMFFGNLQTIKKCIECMMELDPAEVDELIKDGHDWAADHIATSKDDIEEVCNWLCNSLEK